MKHTYAGNKDNRSSVATGMLVADIYTKNNGISAHCVQSNKAEYFEGGAFVTKPVRCKIRVDLRTQLSIVQDVMDENQYFQESVSERRRKKNCMKFSMGEREDGKFSRYDVPGFARKYIETRSSRVEGAV